MSQERSGGFRIAADVANELFAKIGLQLNLAAGSEFTFEFQEPVLDMVNVYELTKALGGATLNKSVRRRLREQLITPFVIIRSLKARSIACYAYNKKDADVSLGARVTKLPVGGDISAQARSDGGVILTTGTGKELVFGIDFYRLVIQGKTVELGRRESEVDRNLRTVELGRRESEADRNLRILKETGATKVGATSGRTFRRGETEWHLELAQRVEPTAEYLNI